MTIKLAARDIPAPNDAAGRDAWLDYVVTGIRTAVQDGGKILVLTTGYADTAALCERLRDIDALVEHKSGERLARVLARVADDSVVVAIGTAK